MLRKTIVAIAREPYFTHKPVFEQRQFFGDFVHSLRIPEQHQRTAWTDYMDDTITERRLGHRRSLVLSLRLRAQGTTEFADVAECVDVSETGIQLRTDLALEVEAILELYLGLPEKATDQAMTEWHCRGRVVRILPENRANHWRTVGVYFERVVLFRDPWGKNT